MKKIYPAIFMLAATLSSYAQQGFICGSDNAMTEYAKQHPEYSAGQQKLQQEMSALDKAVFKNGSQPKTTGTVYIIPCVFHIVHGGGPENISDAQVFDAVKCINNDFRKLNNDTSATFSIFKGISADCEIEVRLATIDPNGNCTKGIDRILDANRTVDNAAGYCKINQWDPKKYLNIWVVKQIGQPNSQGQFVAGYTLLPGQGSQTGDGVVMMHSFTGSIGTSYGAYSRHALPHEVGHFFGLVHPWGASASPGVACGDDGVSDTPITKGYIDCKDPMGSHCTAGVIENVQNIMEYSFCSTMLTQGQKAYARNVLNTTTWSRNNLWTPANLAATGVSGTPALCAADFSTNFDTICAGATVTYLDLSYNGVPTSWSWTFTGGTPATSTASSPSVVYNTPGVYNTTLTVGNGTGSKTATKTNVVLVRGAVGNKYVQDFEGFTFPGTDFTVINRDKLDTWKKTTTVGSSGTSCVYLTNTPNDTNQVDDLIGPGVNMSAMTTAQFTFKVAYAQRTSTTNDKLQVYLSTDCGNSWGQRYVKTGSTLATGPVTTGVFTPTSTQWRKETVTLTSQFTTKTDVMFMFRFTSAGGNNIYIDDINISDLTGIAEDEFGSRLGLNIYPNPLEDNTVINFKLSESRHIDVKVIDMLGRDAALVVNKDLSAGNYSFPLSKEASGLKPGIYFVKMMVDNNRSYTQKIVIQ